MTRTTYYRRQAVCRRIQGMFGGRKEIADKLYVRLMRIEDCMVNPYIWGMFLTIGVYFIAAVKMPFFTHFLNAISCGVVLCEVIISALSLGVLYYFIVSSLYCFYYSWILSKNVYEIVAILVPNNCIDVQAVDILTTLYAFDLQMRGRNYAFFKSFTG